MNLARLEGLFNEMLDFDNASIEYLRYRQPDAYDQLSQVLVNSISHVVGKNFSFLRGSGLFRDQLPDLRKSFIWKGKINQGSELIFNRNLEINNELLKSSDMLQSDADILVENITLTVSRVAGDFVRLKADGKITENYYHISRFTTEMESLFHPNRFSIDWAKEHEYNVGDIVVHIKDEREFKLIKKFNCSNRNLFQGTPLVPKTGESESKFLLSSDLIRPQGTMVHAKMGSTGGILRIGDHVMVRPDHVRYAMGDAGWKVIMPEDTNNFEHWEKCLKTWIGKVDGFRENGELASIVFDNRNIGVVENVFVGKHIRISPVRLRIISENEVSKIFSGKRKSIISRIKETIGRIGQEDMGKRSRRNRVKSQMDLDRKNNASKTYETKAQEDARVLEEDKAAGPYSLSRFANKIVKLSGFSHPWYNDRHGRVDEIDEELGRIFIEFYDGRTNKRFYFRASQGEDKLINIISDIIVSDEGEKV